MTESEWEKEVKTAITERLWHHWLRQRIYALQDTYFIIFMCMITSMFLWNMHWRIRSWGKTEYSRMSAECMINPLTPFFLRKTYICSQLTICPDLSPTTTCWVPVIVITSPLAVLSATLAKYDPEDSRDQMFTSSGTVASSNAGERLSPDGPVCETYVKW